MFHLKDQGTKRRGNAASLRAGVLAASSDHSADTLSCSLDLGDDSFCLGGHEAQSRNEEFASYSVDPLERYLKGDVNLVIQVRSSAYPQIFDFICRRVPEAVAEGAAINCSRTNPNASRHSRRTDWDDKAVSAGVSYLVHSPEGLIPSLVWIEPSQDRADFRWVAAKSFAGKFAINASGVFREGEPGVSWFTSINDDGGAIYSMVKSVSEVPSRVLDNVSDFGGQSWSGDPNAMDLLSSIRIDIDHSGVLLRCDKRSDHFLAFVNLIACMAD
jgi:hypothetical protein